MIQKSSVERVYNGRVGCMCGCRGTYSDTTRSISRAVNKLNKIIDFRSKNVGKNVDFNEDLTPFCAHVEDNGRTTVVYFKKDYFKSTNPAMIAITE